MVRKPSRRKPANASRSRSTSKRAAAPNKPAPRSGSERERIIQAFMQLLAEKPIEEIGLADIAERAGVTLAQLRGEFDSPLAILAAHWKEIDRQVLDGGDADVAEETPRDRLFDVLMRRLEAMTPYKPALRSLMRSALRNPGLALALNKLAVRSQQWMLTAAGIGVSGPKGMLRSQGLSLLYASVLRTWLDDDDPGLSKTMAALDQALTRGQSWSRLLDDLCAVIPTARCPPRRRRSRRDEEPAAA
jgi:AcrR family transcriptional regulator